MTSSRVLVFWWGHLLSFHHGTNGLRNAAIFITYRLFILWSAKIRPKPGLLTSWKQHVTSIQCGCRKCGTRAQVLFPTPAPGNIKNWKIKKKEASDSFDILGVMFDSKLTFEDRVRGIVSCVSQRIVFLRLVKHVFVDTSVLILC